MTGRPQRRSGDIPARRSIRYFETTEPSVDTCRRCSATVIFGLAEGLAARVDLVPIANETAALAAGCQTYTLLRSGLVHRDEMRRSGPELAGPILAEHRCHGGAPSASPTGPQPHPMTLF